MWDIFKAKRLIPFACGVLFGTAGVSVLSSKDAKKAYTHITAAGLRAQKKIMTTYDCVKENCDDILADAKELNEKIEAEEIIEDEA